MQKILGLSMLMMAAVGCYAAIAQTPEIDPSSAGAAVALLAGGLLVLRYRRKK